MTLKLKIEKVYLPEIQDRIALLNPTMVNILNETKLNYPFYIVRYPFGGIIAEKGRFYIPLEDGTTKNISDPDIPAAIRNDLDYLSIDCTPIGLLLNHSMELSFQRAGQSILLVQMMPGWPFGLWRTIDTVDKTHPQSYHSQDAWFIKAGFRHGFMLPKISMNMAYAKLAKAKGLRMKSPPRDLYSHYEIFKDIAKHRHAVEPWYTEVLYFSKQWLEHLHELPQLELFFYKTITRQSRFWRNKIVYDFMWDSFIAEIKKENLAIKPHIIDIAKHILMVALGALPSFAPAMDNASAPIQGIQQDFLDIYGLKAAPVIMTPTHFDMYNPDTKPAYWSLQFPCYLESVPNPKTRTSNLDDLNEIALLIDYLFDNVDNKKLPVIINTPIEYCLQHVKFDYFHSDVPSYHSKIRPSRDMPLEDKRLVQCIVPGREHDVFEFSEVSPFVRGCIRFSLRT